MKCCRQSRVLPDRHHNGGGKIKPRLKSSTVIKKQKDGAILVTGKAWFKVDEEGLEVIENLNGDLTVEQLTQQFEKTSVEMNDFLKLLAGANVIEFDSLKDVPLAEKDFKSPFPILVSWNITNECNQKCVYCYNAPKGKESKKLLKIADKLIEAQVPVLNITGGEPLLRPEIFDIIEKVRPHMKIFLSTNATLVTDEIARILASYDLERILISLDGPKEIHNSLRSDSFDDTICGIKKLVEAGANVTLTTVLSNKTFPTIDETVALAKELGACEHRIIFLKGEGRAKDGKLILENTSEAIKKIMDLEKKFPNFVRPEIPFRFMFERIPIASCTAFRTTCGLDCDGTVYSCIELGDPVDNIFNKPLLKIWKENKPLAEKKEIKVNCKYVDECRGACSSCAKNATGDMNNCDPRCPIIRGEINE